MPLLHSLLQQARLSLPDACRAIRKAHGVSQDEFARRVGVNRKVVKDLERGKGNPRMDSLAQIARAAGMRLAFVPEGSLVGVLDAKQRLAEEEAQRHADAAALDRSASPEELYRRNAMPLGGVSLRLPKLG